MCGPIFYCLKILLDEVYNTDLYLEYFYSREGTMKTTDIYEYKIANAFGKREVSAPLLSLKNIEETIQTLLCGFRSHSHNLYETETMFCFFLSFFLSLTLVFYGSNGKLTIFHNLK